MRFPPPRIWDFPFSFPPAVILSSAKNKTSSPCLNIPGISLSPTQKRKILLSKTLFESKNTIYFHEREERLHILILRSCSFHAQVEMTPEMEREKEEEEEGAKRNAWQEGRNENNNKSSACILDQEMWGALFLTCD